MNPWHDGWKLHRLKGSVMAHMLLRCLGQALALVRARVEAGAQTDAVLAELRAIELPQLSGIGG
jgi:hypothetical protein